MHDKNKKQKNQEPPKGKKKRIYPGEDTFAPKPDNTSMSAGNLVNNPAGRTRTRDLHTKISTTGSDDDGQAV